MVQVNARIIYLCLEDARAVRAALCAGHAAGLRPRDGAVWLLPAALTPAALTPRRSDPCLQEHLREMLDGHFSIAPEWQLPWLDESNNVST